MVIYFYSFFDANLKLFFSNCKNLKIKEPTPPHTYTIFSKLMVKQANSQL